MALVVAPESPLDAWLAALDEQIARSRAFFADRPVVINFLAGNSEMPAPAEMLDDLASRGLKIIGVEGVPREALKDSRWEDAWILGPSSRDRLVALPDDQAEKAAKEDPVPESEREVPAAPTLIVDRPVRSGQSIVSEMGDVVVMGAVASGAEVIAGGSIHVYGALRGRAVAGVQGSNSARIFARRLFSELLAIDGLYRTAEHWGEGLHGHAVQARLEGESLRISALD